jgi:ribonuclease HI
MRQSGSNQTPPGNPRQRPKPGWLMEDIYNTSFRGNTKQATVFQSEVIAVQAAAETLISNNPFGQPIVFHVDNQATLKTLDSTDITKNTCKDTRDSLNALGKENTVVLEWVKAHMGILGNKEADKLAKAGGNSTAVLGTGATVKSAIKKELKENMTNEWNRRWQSTIDYRQTKVWFPTIDIPKSEILMKHTRPTVGRTARNISGFAFYRRESAIIEQSRNPPLVDVSCRLCREDDETPIHIICDCGHFVEHRLDTIGVHQMPEENPEYDMESIIKFLQKEEIILMEDC